ncbi:MAG: acyl-CoA thioesterase [Bdellovibrionaceae bacterium]|nr:acyl-CoA thioesterase [Pseudobdellovibrionaceae bacterium]
MSTDKRRFPSLMSYHVYPRRVAYYETDAMGVLHHSNHVRFFEEARVALLRDRGWMEIHQPAGPYVFAVTEQSARYFKPAVFDEALEIWTQMRRVGARLEFQYALFSQASQTVIAAGGTRLVPIDTSFRVAKLPASFLEAVDRESWDEAWPPKPQV